jgi:CheY-like chemotaxis protein
LEESEANDSKSHVSSLRSQTKIIALTASVFEEDRTRMIQEGGCDDYVRKPYKENVIFDMMAQHLGVRYLHEEVIEDQHDVPLNPLRLTPDDLADLPGDWRMKLRHAAMRGQDALVLSLIKFIEDEYPEVARELATLGHHFRFDLLVALTEPSKNTE